MALFTAQELIQCAVEATTLEYDRIVTVIEGERLTDDTGEPEDIAYNKAIADVLAAIIVER